MIWEWKSCSIVMLTELEERGQVSSKRSWALGVRDHMKSGVMWLRRYVGAFFLEVCPQGHFQAVLPNRLVSVQ